MNRKTALRRGKRRAWKRSALLWLITFAFVGVLLMIVYTLAGAESIGAILGDKTYWLSLGVACGILSAGYLTVYRIDAQNIALHENDLEDTDWLTPKRLRKLKEFTVTDWNKLPEKPDGIVIGAEKKGKSAEIVMTDQLHALIVGTTGSGKTTGFVDQNIAVLSHCKTKPSLVITDPKKELYEKHGRPLEEAGYKISVLDLREPYSSAKWNPMNVLIRRIRLVKELQNNLTSKDGKYYGAGETFLSFDAARLRVQELKDEIYENAQDLVYTLCPVQNRDQPTWEAGARNLIFGLVLAFCEDCIKGKMDEKQLLLFNVYHNITKYCSEDTTALKEYLLQGRDEFSKVRGLVNTVLITSDRTLTSYLSEVNAYMQQLSDDGILSLTSENELDILNMDEEPNAVFIIVPDERFTRHRFVTLFITQMYKELVEKANLNDRRKQTQTAILKRNVYYIMDEWGNLPKFENVEGMVTVARSRGIRFLFVLQSFSQLAAKYGRDIADILKANCNVKLFIGSDDAETRREFSELCGQKKVKSFSVNTNAETSASSNTGATNQPLITVGMLERINGDEKGDAIVSIRGYEPIWSRFTPSYELSELYFGSKAEKPQEEEKDAEYEEEKVKLFQKETYLYDIGGGKFKTEREKMLEKVEKDEDAEEQAESERKEYIAGLDAQWKETEQEVRKRLEKLLPLLDKQDAKALQKAALENKLPLLYMIGEHYNKSIEQKLRAVAEVIEEQLAQMRKLQEQAIATARAAA